MIREAPTWEDRAENLLVVLVLALSFHALYGGLGFNPTDEGFLLAQARRILEGQVPHRDFISPRPVLSPLLHAHLHLWAGDGTLWWGRLIAALELAVTARLWVLMAGRVWNSLDSPLRRTLATFLGFAASVHIFPVMPWHTVDGILLLTLGVSLARGSSPSRYRGLFLAGAAVLCRQNFVLVLPFALIASGRMASPLAWLSTILPILLYGAAITLLGGGSDLLLQLTANTGSFWGLLTVGLRYQPPYLLQGFVMGCMASALIRMRPRSPGTVRVLQLLASSCIAIPILITLYQIDVGAPYGFSPVGWMPLGASLGLLPAAHRDPRQFRLLLLAVVLGFAISISLGNPAPSLAAGALLAHLCAALDLALPRPRYRGPARLQVLAALLLMVATGYTLDRARTILVYRDRPQEELVFNAGDHLAGARGLMTNETTWSALRDLKSVTDRVRIDHPREWRYAVLPDGAAWWVAGEDLNPLPVDWLFPVEVADNRLRDRVRAALQERRGRMTVILQKYDASFTAWKLQPFARGERPILDEIRAGWRKIGETEYYEIYE